MFSLLQVTQRGQNCLPSATKIAPNSKKSQGEISLQELLLPLKPFHSIADSFQVSKHFWCLHLNPLTTFIYGFGEWEGCLGFNRGQKMDTTLPTQSTK